MKKLQNTILKNKKILPLAVIAVFATVGALIVAFSSAAVPNATLTMTPNSGSYPINTTFKVDIHEDSLAEPVVGTSVRVAYDPAKLEVVTASNEGSAFNFCTDAIVGTTVVEFDCVITTSGGLTGRRLVGSITFRARTGTGTSSPTFVNSTTNGSAITTLSAPSENIWNRNTAGATFAFTTPDTTPPTSSISSPLNNAVVNGSSVVITAAADDGQGSGVEVVEFFVTANNVTTKLGEARTSPYRYTWNTTNGSYPDGQYILTTRATDRVGLRSNPSTPVTVTVQNNRPDLVVTSISLAPANPETGDEVTISAVVRNSGNAAIASGQARVTRFQVGTTVLANVSNSAALGINASQTITSTVRWTAITGTHNIVATADAGAQITESNESNNTNQISIRVYNKGDTGNDPGGLVDYEDLLIVAQNWNRTNATRAQGDLNSDGLVNYDDLVIVARNWTR